MHGRLSKFSFPLSYPSFSWAASCCGRRSSPATSQPCKFPPHFAYYSYDKLTSSLPSHRRSPPRTWFYRNFAVLFAVALLPYLWFTTMFDVNMILWQDVYGWNSLACALRMIPSGVVTFSMSLTGPPREANLSKVDHPLRDGLHGRRQHPLRLC